MRVNRKAVENAIRNGLPLQCAVERAVGKTTSAVLMALGESYSKPGEWIEVKDPDLKSHAKVHWLIHAVQDHMRLLGLKCIEVRDGARLGERAPRPPYTPGRHAVYVRNTFCERLEWPV